VASAANRSFQLSSRPSVRLQSCAVRYEMTFPAVYNASAQSKISWLILEAQLVMQWQVWTAFGIMVRAYVFLRGNLEAEHFSTKFADLYFV
jgi:hypothetical protein